MRFFWNNLIDLVGNVFTESSEASTLPSSNIANEFKGLPWRTGASVADEWVVIDLGSAQAVTSVILFAHTLTSGDSAIAVQAHTSDAWGAPSFSQTLTWSSGAIVQTFASQSYRFWRIKFTKSAAGQSRDIGRVFLGTYLQAVDDPDYDGYNKECVDSSQKSKSIGGQTWVKRRENYNKIEVHLSRFTQADIDAFQTMFDTVGESKSFFFQCQTSSPLNTTWYVKFTRSYETDVAAYNGGYLWDTNFEMEEQL